MANNFQVALTKIWNVIDTNWLRKAKTLNEGSFVVLPIEVTQEHFAQLKQGLISSLDYSERMAYCFMLAYALEKHHIVDTIREMMYQRECPVTELLAIEEALNVLFMYVTGEACFLYQEPSYRSVTQTR